MGCIEFLELLWLILTSMFDVLSDVVNSLDFIGLHASRTVSGTFYFIFFPIIPPFLHSQQAKNSTNMTATCAHGHTTDEQHRIYGAIGLSILFWPGLYLVLSHHFILYSEGKSLFKHGLTWKDNAKLIIKAFQQKIL